MNGYIENLHAMLPVTFRVPNHSDIVLPFVIDTGFTDDLTLPPSVVARLGLEFEYELIVNLANDTDTVVRVHNATILWQDEEREIRVFATGRRPLLGTGLLANCELVTQFCENGVLTVEPL